MTVLYPKNVKRKPTYAHFLEILKIPGYPNKFRRVVKYIVVFKNITKNNSIKNNEPVYNKHFILTVSSHAINKFAMYA